MKVLIIEQKFAPLANQYRVFDTDENGTKRNMISFASQKRFAFKEQVEFFTDESRSNLAFTVRAEKVMDIHGKFIVSDAEGRRLGAVRKAFKASLLRSTWEILNSSDEIAVIVRERSESIAIFRRVWQFIPLLSDVPFFIKYHFDFVNPQDGTLRATYYKTTRFRDYYRLELQDEQLYDQIGWQTLVTQAVLLDALQGR